MGCLFCRIVRGEIPSTMVYQDEQVLAFRDINPQAPVHILVVPKEHLTDLGDLSEENQSLAGHILYVVSQLAEREGLRAGGYRVVANTGEAAGQTVPHLHLHLLGGRAFGWPPG
ncbi:MAG: histidine triad nucleotide-binding protein [Symbiobacteriia bacterium]